VSATSVLELGRRRGRRPALFLRLLAAPVTGAIVVLGLWVAGGLITNDFVLAMRLSVGWMALAGLVALAIAVRSRAFRWPVLGAYFVTAAAIGAWLASSIFMDNVVNEPVATAAPASARPAERAAKQAAPRNVLLRAGSFQSVRHSAHGEAQVIRLARGGRVLTLTDFAVDNGPDLRVYLVAGPARSEGEVDNHVDLGGLKGNVGNQQYELPTDLSVARYSTVVIWCRAFSVLFARAPLSAQAS
jgi:Electron transfer DM13